MLVTDDTSQLEISPLKTDAQSNPHNKLSMLVTSEVSKHLTKVSFKQFSDSILSLLSLVIVLLISRQGEGVVAGTPDRLDRIKSILLWMKRIIGSLIEFVLSNK